MTHNEQKVLNFMIKNPRLDYLASEIQKGAKISKAGANLSLKSLVKQRLIEYQKRGKAYFYFVHFEDVEIKEFKKLNNISRMKPLVRRLSRYALKIVLFGSAARGENLGDSDFDLFVLTRVPEKVRELLNERNKLQVIIKTPIEFTEFERQNPIFSKEIDNGIILWQQP